MPILSLCKTAYFGCNDIDHILPIIIQNVLFYWIFSLSYTLLYRTLPAILGLPGTDALSIGQ